jgi:hypothetical protein
LFQETSKWLKPPHKTGWLDLKLYAAFETQSGADHQAALLQERNVIAPPGSQHATAYQGEYVWLNHSVCSIKIVQRLPKPLSGVQSVLPMFIRPSVIVATDKGFKQQEVVFFGPLPPIEYCSPVRRELL